MKDTHQQHVPHKTLQTSYELIPTIKELEKTIGKLTPDIPITADNDYYSDENLEYPPP